MAAQELAARGFDVRVFPVIAPAKQSAKPILEPSIVKCTGTQYSAANIFADPARWAQGRDQPELSYPSEKVSHSCYVRFPAFLVKVGEPPDPAGFTGLDIVNSAALQRFAEQIEKPGLSVDDREIDDRERPNVTWTVSKPAQLTDYCLFVKSYFAEVGSSVPVDPGLSESEQTRILGHAMDTIQHDLKNPAWAGRKPRELELVRNYLHPDLGINLLRRAIPGNRPTVDGALVELVVELVFGPSWPMKIEFDELSDLAPRLSVFGEMQIETVSRSLRRFGADYQSGAWFTVTIRTEIDPAWTATDVVGMEPRIRVIEDQLRGQMRRASADSNLDPLIARRVYLNGDSPPAAPSYEVAIDPTFPRYVEFKPSTSFPTRNGWAALEELAVAARSLLANDRAQWFSWRAEHYAIAPATGVDPSLVLGQRRIDFIRRWAENLRTELQTQGRSLQVLDLRDPQKPVRHPPWARAQSEGVLLDWNFQTLPGEHRPVVIAPHHRHLSDTLRRIPGYLEPEGQRASSSGSCSQTLWDRLQPVSTPGASEPLHAGALRTRSTMDLAHAAGLFDRLRDDPIGFSQFVFRLVRYAMTCSDRRGKELEDLSFWDYLEARDNRLRIPRYRYSDQFKRDVDLACRTVVGADADCGDARTCANMFLQLFRNWIRPVPEADRVFPGPTTDTWLNPWCRHLENNDAAKPGQVHLETGEQEITLRFENGRVVVDHGDEPSARYHILATDAETAYEFTCGLPGGVPEQLHAWLHPEDDRTGTERLHTQTGIQFFFVNDEGEEMEDAQFCVRNFAWSLRVLTSHKFWDRRPTIETDGFTGMVSVDILDWDSPATEGPMLGRTAWECTGAELAEEVWRQISPHLRVRLRDGAPAIKPRWYHIGNNIHYSGEPFEDLADPAALAQAGPYDGPAKKDTAPYAVPWKGDWKNRPGTLDADDRYQGKAKNNELLWQSRHGGYLVHGGTLVFAGPYLKTHTRTSDLEAASESARHAVNAILRHHAEDADLKPFRESATNASEMWSFSRGDLISQAIPAPTASPTDEDLCEIWDPEKNELAELEKLKRYDQWCFDRKLPHPWDVLSIEALPTLMSWVTTPMVPSAFARPGDAERVTAGAPPWGGDAVLRLLRSVRETLEAQMKSGSQTSQQYPHGIANDTDKTRRS